MIPIIIALGIEREMRAIYPEYDARGKDRHFRIGQTEFLAVADSFNPGRWNLYARVAGEYYRHIDITSVVWEEINKAAVLAFL